MSADGQVSVALEVPLMLLLLAVQLSVGVEVEEVLHQAGAGQQALEAAVHIAGVAEVPEPADRGDGGLVSDVSGLEAAGLIIEQSSSQRVVVARVGSGVRERPVGWQDGAGEGGVWITVGNLVGVGRVGQIKLREGAQGVVGPGAGRAAAHTESVALSLHAVRVLVFSQLRRRAPDVRQTVQLGREGGRELLTGIPGVARGGGVRHVSRILHLSLPQISPTSTTSIPSTTVLT